MDRFEAPQLQKSSTYHIVAQDDMDMMKEPLVEKPAPLRPTIIRERPMSTASSNSSITLRDMQQTTHCLANMHRRRRRKPLAGDRILKAVRRTPPFFKYGFLAIVSGIPFIVFTVLAYTIWKDKCIGPDKLGITVISFAKYLDIGWATLLVIIALASCMGRFFSWACRKSVETARYENMARVMSFRITMMLWIGAMRLATCRTWQVSMMTDFQDDWVYKLRVTLEFMAIAALLFLVQGIFVQTIAIKYIQGYIGPRSQNAVNELEMLERLNHLVKPRSRSKGMAKIFRKLFTPPKEHLLDAIHKGKSSDQEVRGYASILWTTVAGAETTITMADIHARLLSLKRDPDDAADLFEILDRDGDGVANRQEFEDLIAQTVQQLKSRAVAMEGISIIMKKLEFMFTVVMIVAILFLYRELFSEFKSASTNISRRRILQQRSCNPTRDALGRHGRNRLRLLSTSCGASKFLRLGFRKTFVRCRRSRQCLGPHAGGTEYLPHTHEFRGVGWWKEAAGADQPSEAEYGTVGEFDQE